MAAESAALDFTNVKEAGAFNPRRQAAGDYKAKVTAVVDAESKKSGKPQWLFTIQVNGASYPYYCQLEEASLWKIRNLLIAAGVNVPKKRVKVNPNIVVGKNIGVTLEDDEYDGKLKSVIQATFPASELNEDDVPDEDEDAEDDEEDDSPPPRKAKAKPAPVDEDDDEDEEEEPAPPPKKAKAKTPPPVEDDDDDDLEEIDIDDT
jgi:hypothetical protein